MNLLQRDEKYIIYRHKEINVDRDLMIIFDIANCSKGLYLLKGIYETQCHSAFQEIYTLVKRYNILISHKKIRNMKMCLNEIIY